MKSRLQIDDAVYLLEWTGGKYLLTGAETATGAGSVVEVQPGVFSVLANTRQTTVHVLTTAEGLQVAVGGERFEVLVSDARDRASGSKRSAATGPYEIRSQMPGKVVEILVTPGECVKAGQGLLVIEAMKMQNEVKAPRDGVVAKIFAAEGATVGTAVPLMLINPMGAQ